MTINDLRRENMELIKNKAPENLKKIEANNAIIKKAAADLSRNYMNCRNGNYQHALNVGHIKSIDSAIKGLKVILFILAALFIALIIYEIS